MLYTALEPTDNEILQNGNGVEETGCTKYLESTSRLFAMSYHVATCWYTFAAYIALAGESERTR